MGTRIRFLGAADTVTGSRYLLQTDAATVLVDCGLFQGYKKLRQRNWSDPPFDPCAIDAVVLTHAHIDHSGWLPRLCKLGFRGPVYCTPGTQDLLRILLPDAAYLEEEDARRANRYGYTRHRPAEPLFTRQDADRSLTHVRAVPFGQRIEVAPGIQAAFTRAGHIHGSACAGIETPHTTIAFSGDVGRPNDALMLPPEPMPRARHLVVESTYGDRRHPREDPAETLARVVHETVARGGVILVPTFAVGRAQHLLHLLAGLRASGRIPEIPIHLDSPMAIDATRVFCERDEDRRLTAEQCREICEVATYSHTAEDSKAIDRRSEPMIVLSASGMATGGRILHHLRRFMPQEQNTVLFVGHQAVGTRGRSLVDGADEIKIHGEYVPVRARIVQLHGLSAHADYTEMIEWLRASKLAPRRVFVTHGEAAAADALRRRLHDTFGWNAVVPDDGSSWALD